MFTKRLKELICCHKGAINRLLHIVGFSLIGVGIWQTSFSLVILGAIAQELGHFYQFAKTKNIKDSPSYCLKPQALFAYPVFIFILVYIWVAK